MTPINNQPTLRTNSPPRPDKPLKRSQSIRTAQAFYDALSCDSVRKVNKENSNKE